MRTVEDFEAGADEQSLTAGTIFTVDSTSGTNTGVYDTARAAHGGTSARLTAAAGFRISLNGAVDTDALAVSAHFWLPADPQPAANDPVLIGLYRGATRLLTLQFQAGTGRLRVTDAAGASSHVWTDTIAFPTEQQVRLEVFAEVGTTTGNGRVRVAYYAGDGLTALGDSTLLTNVNLGTENITVVRLGIGMNSPGGRTVWVDSVMVEDEATGLLGPFTPQLPTPVVTVTAQSNPTAPGAADGTVTVTWPDVPGAASYEAWHAAGVTPAQEDFTLRATEVPKPYVFTGLTAGFNALGIKAKA